MLNSTFHKPGDSRLNVLCLGAHCDDIEIGCGGTLLRLVQENMIAHIHWVVFASNESRKKEAIASAEKFLHPLNKTNVNIEVHGFRDGYLPSNWSRVKDEFEKIKKVFTPDLIFTHYKQDLHQDHRTLGELTWNTFRNHLILEYEIPKYDGDLGHPNLFVPLTAWHTERKKQIVLDCFKSQLNKQWLDDTLLTSLMRIRGVECASESGYAEAFYSRKQTIEIVHSKTGEKVLAADIQNQESDQNEKHSNARLPI